MELFNDKDPLKDEYGIAALCWPTHDFMVLLLLNIRKTVGPQNPP